MCVCIHFTIGGALLMAYRYYISSTRSSNPWAIVLRVVKAASQEKSC